MATGIKVTMLCPGPTFSNLLAGAATEKTGEVSYLDSWLCHKVGKLVKFLGVVIFSTTRPNLIFLRVSTSMQ